MQTWCNSLDELSLSYNGGKDCLVLLLLFLAGLHAHYHPSPTTITSPTTTTSTNSTSAFTTTPTSTSPPSHTESAPPSWRSPFPTSLRSIYILSTHPFPEVDAFVAHSSQHYRLALARSAPPMQQAFAAYLAQPAHAGVRAIFVGTRRTDPHGGSLTHFDPTDRGWPAFMRVHPVIDWHYREIWKVSSLL